MIHFICINKYRLIEKVLICGVWWVKFPKFPYSDRLVDSFTILEPYNLFWWFFSLFRCFSWRFKPV